MKKQYKTPVTVYTEPTFDVEVMAPITPSHGSVDDGLSKERDDFDDLSEDEEIIEELQQMEQTQQPLW